MHSKEMMYVLVSYLMFMVILMLWLIGTYDFDSISVLFFKLVLLDVSVVHKYVILIEKYVNFKLR